MIKKILFLILSMALLNSIVFARESADYKGEMRSLIYDIRERAGNEKIIIANGGIAIYYDDDKINEKFLSRVNGILVESVAYGFGGYNKKTPKDQQNVFFNLLLPLKQRGKEIILLEYTDNKNAKKEVEKIIEEKHFKGETPLSIGLNSIYTPTRESKGGNISGIEDSSNILVLLNYEKFSSAEELVKVLSYTNFDFLIIDPFVGKEILTKEQVNRIKTRPDGTKRKVIAYISLGEAETYRSYWNSKWKVGNPKWLIEENKNWANNYIVEFWNPQWKDIIKNMQLDINNSDFDGYFLDTIDSYQRFENK